jgi:hypothetical protein
MRPPDVLTRVAQTAFLAVCGFPSRKGADCRKNESSPHNRHHKAANASVSKG